jgi:hypothetical protein
MQAYAAPDPTPEPRQPAQDPPSGEWLPLAEAAQRLGCSVDTMRRRLKRGELQGRQVPMQGGHRWEVFVPLAAAEPTQPRQSPPIAGTEAPRQPRQDLQALVDLVRDLTARNEQLAGQAAHWQTRAQLAEDRLKLLEAPRENSTPTPTGSPPWWERWWPWRRSAVTKA